MPYLDRNCHGALQSLVSLTVSEYAMIRFLELCCKISWTLETHTDSQIKLYAAGLRILYLIYLAIRAIYISRGFAVPECLLTLIFLTKLYL